MAFVELIKVAMDWPSIPSPISISQSAQGSKQSEFVVPTFKYLLLIAQFWSLSMETITPQANPYEQLNLECEGFLSNKSLAFVTSTFCNWRQNNQFAVD